MKTFLHFLTVFIFTIYSVTGQSDCAPIPEVDFPGGRVVMSFDGNVHDDDDIVAMAYSAGLWWAAGLQDKVVQIEYSNHVCDTDSNESDGAGAGAGDDSQNMRETASGAISQFGYNPNIFYDYERQGSASTAKMAAEIEKSSASDPLWIIAAGPMETVWRGLEQANKGFDHVTIISHSKWNQNHTHCNGAHDWNDLKNKYQSKGIFFVENCSGGSCNSPNGLNDQNGGFNSSKSNWSWMLDSDKEYNRWIYGRNPFSSNKFDPSDAGMSYYLITGGPFDGGNKTPDHNDARKLMENPCQNNDTPVENVAPTLSFKTPSNGTSVKVGENITVEASAKDSDGSIADVSLFVNNDLVRKDSQAPYVWSSQDNGLKNLKRGNYTLKLVAKDDDGATTTRTLNISVVEEDTDTENESPVLSISSPGNNQTFATGEDVSIDVSATDDGRVVKYRIFVNDKLVDTDGTNFTPHTIATIQKGSYDIRVEVTDDQGSKTVKTITIQVKDGEDEEDPSDDDEEEEEETPDTESSTFSFVSPTEGADYSVGETITVDLAATANGNDIVRYQVFVNDKLVDTDPANFTPYRITNAQTGTYTIRAEATESNGTKSVKTLLVNVGNVDSPEDENPPENDDMITLTVSPSDGQSFGEGETVSIDVSAKGGKGKIVKYQIFVNGKLVDTDPAYFTPHNIKNITKGVYTIKVEVTDDKGRKKSETVEIRVGGTSASLVARLPENGTFFGDAISLRIAPNPIKGTTLNVYRYGGNTLRITNLYGVLVKQIDDAEEETKIDVSTLAPGIYILESDSESTKFIIPE